MAIFKSKNHRLKNFILLKDRDIDNRKVSSAVSSGEKSYKYLIDYKDDDYKIKSLCIMFPNTSGYVKS